MAVDTRQKRASCIGLNWPYNQVWPDPDGDLAVAADRQQMAYCYSGVAAAEPMPVDSFGKRAVGAERGLKAGKASRGLKPNKPDRGIKA